MKGKHSENTEGIIIGFNKIPIDRDILFQMKSLNLDPDYVLKCLEANRHNNATTSYYLSLKKYISEGKKAGLWLGILFLITACIKIWDTVETYRNNRKL